MAPDIYKAPPGMNGPVEHLLAATADTDFANISRAIYVGGAGNLVLQMKDGANVTLTAVPAGTWLWVRASRYLATGTTATSILYGY